MPYKEAGPAFPIECLHCRLIGTAAGRMSLKPKIPASLIAFPVLATQPLMTQSARTSTAVDLTENYASNKKNLRISDQNHNVQNQENGQMENTYAHS